MSKSQELKEQQKIWYEKLKAEGFEDIEQDEIHLKAWSSSTFHRSVRNTDAPSDLGVSKTTHHFDDKIEYFRRAGQFLYEHKFDSDFEKRAWQLHSEGKYLREIAEALRSDSEVLKANKDNINTIIKKLTKLMIKSLGKTAND